MIRLAGLLALLASIALAAILVQGLRHFDLKVIPGPSGGQFTMHYPGPGPYQHFPGSTSVGRRAIDWDREMKCWSINHEQDLVARLQSMGGNADVCHREFTLPLGAWTLASTTFIPRHETTKTRPPAHSWAIFVSLGALAATPLLAWSVAALVVGLFSRRRRPVIRDA